MEVAVLAPFECPPEWKGGPLTTHLVWMKVHNLKD